MGRINFVQILKMAACLMLAVLMIGLAVSAFGAVSDNGTIGGGTTGGTTTGGTTTGGTTGGGATPGNKDNTSADCKHVPYTSCAAADDEVHNVWTLCGLCNQSLAQPVREAHTFDSNNTCTKCKRVKGTTSTGGIVTVDQSTGNTVTDTTGGETGDDVTDGSVPQEKCNHLKKSAGALTGYAPAEKYVYLTNGSVSHTCRKVCEKCNHIFSSTTKVHNFGSDGVCIQCGDACKHAQLTAASKTYVDLDAEYHCPYGTCQACGLTVKLESKKVKHRFNGTKCADCGHGCSHEWDFPDALGACKCDLCGYECFHANGFVEGTTSVKYGSGGHWTEGECAICGYNEAKSAVTPHTLNSSGRCSGCAYQCAHSNTGLSYGDRNSTQHTTYTECRDCGYMVSTKTDGHSFDDGVCVVCGYGCEEHTFADSSTADGGTCTKCGYKCQHDPWDPASTFVEDWDEATHAYTPICDTCNMMHYELENHNFIKGTCVVCNYKCKHPGVTKVGDICGRCTMQITDVSQITK